MMHVQMRKKVFVLGWWGILNNRLKFRKLYKGKENHAFTFFYWHSNGNTRCIIKISNMF